MAGSIVKEKSFDFALRLIELYKEMRTQKEFVISKQLLKSGTSIGANIEEALAGQSRKDFTAKMSIASKEARETKYWLMLLSKSNLIQVETSTLLKDIEELICMLTSIVKTTQTTPTQNSKLKTKN